jgi:murein L,D-transpeptidase YafK
MLIRPLGLFLLVVCLMSPSAADAQAPQSERSRAAMARVIPSLKGAVEEAGLTWGAAVFLRVFKEESRLEAWLETAPGGPFALFRAYDICAWSGDLGPKTQEGDRQAPEGFYAVGPGQMNPHSRFHLSFNLGYPNAYERARGWTGSALMVHGDCVSVGCYAMGKRFIPLGADRNDPINELWTLMTAAFDHGQPFVRVHAFPFVMTREALARHVGHPWAGFWANLAEGSRWFEQHRRPPNVILGDGRYRFGPG